MKSKIKTIIGLLLTVVEVVLCIFALHGLETGNDAMVTRSLLSLIIVFGLCDIMINVWVCEDDD